MNAPERHERFVVPEGVKKVDYEPDTKNQNAGTIHVQREDHTLGNLIRMQLHRNPAVLFAGYKAPHPLEYRIFFKIQTTADTTPQAAFKQALDELYEELEVLDKAFSDEVEANKRDFY